MRATAFGGAAGLSWLPAALLVTVMGASVPARPAAEPARLAQWRWLPKAPPLAGAGGPVIRVATVEDLFRAAVDVKPGGTILIADGHYPMPTRLDLQTDGVTLRGESGRRDAVVLDAAEL